MPRLPLVLAVSVASLAAALVVAPATPAQAAGPAQQIFFSADTDDDLNFGVYRSSPSGSGRTAFLPERADISYESPAVSPDGSQIAYLRVNATNRTTIWVVNAGGFGARSLGSGPVGSIFRLAWTPDGSRLLFNSFDKAPFLVTQVFVSSGATGSIPRSEEVNNPYVDPSVPNRIVGNRNRGVLVSMPMDGSSAPTKLPGSPASTSRAAVASDGSVVFTHITDDNPAAPKANLVRLSRSGVATVLATGQYNARASVSPDGATVYFDKFADETQKFYGDLYSVPLAGGTPTRITATTLTDEGAVTAGVVDTTAPTGAVTALGVTLAGSRPVLRWTRPADATDVLVCRKAGTVAPSSAADCGTTAYRGSATTLTDSVVAGSVYSYAVFAMDRHANVGTAAATLTMRALVASGVRGFTPTSTVNTTPPFTVSWTDSGAGASYDVTWAARSGATSTAFAAWRTGTTTRSGVFGAGSVPTGVAPGTTYTLRVVTVDGYGNRSASATSPFVVPFDQTKASYTAGWSTASRAGTWLGSATSSLRKGASASVVLTGNRVSIIGDRCPTCGAFQVLVNGTVVATVDSRGSQLAARQVLWSSPSLGATAARTIKVVVVGTSGRPRVALDGFATTTR